MPSAFPKRTSTPRLLSRERLTSFTLLPSKFQWEKFLNMKMKAITGTSFLPRIGPCVDLGVTRPKLPSDPLKPNLLQISPPEVEFQNFSPRGVSEMALSLTNVGKVPQVVKVSMESSPYFQLLCSSDIFRLVPPGGSAPVHIRFTPRENKDYSHELVCVTENERIVVPIRAIGARAILNLPAQLDFSKCPVKVSTQQTLLVHNVGNQAARYQLSTQSPFSVVPAIGILGAGDTVQVTVEFHPLTKGDYCSLLSCSTGEENIHTNLHGEAVDVNAGLSTNSVEFDKTFITMSSHRTLFIENRGNITAHFQWKAFPTEEEENEEKRRQRRFLRTQRELWLEKLKEEREAGKEKGSGEDRAAHLRLLGEMAKLHQDPMLFSDDIFFIEPMEGEIRPNCSAEINVTFKPLEGLEYLSVAYCSISGCESRLPLHLSGEGQGPLIEFSSPTLNLGNISINNSYVYEVELMNLGAIDAHFTYIPSAANVGFCFKFAPEQGIIAAGGSQIIHIFFSATVVGRFLEEFQFSVAGSPMSAILAVRGCVTGLRSRFEVNELDCGDISPGSTYTVTSSLSNTSPVSRASLWGEAHSPNLQIQPSTLEFGCLVGGTAEEKCSLEMAKCSSLPVQHHWSICSSSQENSLRCEPYPSKFQPQPPKGKRPSLDSSASLRRRFRIRNVEEPATALKESWDFAQSPGAEVPPQTPEHPQLPAGLAGISSSLDAPHTPLEAEKVSDTENILGIVQAENIKISAEVCDVSLSTDMPEAVRVNHIEFGHCPVGESCWRALTISSHAQTKVMRFEWEADAPFHFSPKVGHLHPGCAKDITVTLRSDVPATFRRHLVKCKVTTINLELPQRKVQDWDDQMTITMWKNTTGKDLAARWPQIERVVKAVPEPAHTVLEESSQEVEVYLSAVVAHAQFQLSTTRIQFKDTLPFQTRTATFMMHNTGEVALKYSWEKAQESEPVKKPFPTTLMRRFLSYNPVKQQKKLLCLFWSEQDHPAERSPKVWQQPDSGKQQEEQISKQQEEQVFQEEKPEQQDCSKNLCCSKQKNLSPKRASSSLEAFPDDSHDLFSINPYYGSIPPGHKQTFHVQFSPKHTGKFKATLLCRIPNLEPAQRMRQVIVEGRVQEWKNLDEPLE